MSQLSLSTLISEEAIQQKVIELGAELTKKFKGQKIITVCVLRGAFIFYADLIRQIDAEITCEFLGVSSYSGQTQSSGEVKMTLDLSHPIEGKHVLLVEDIVDTGLTMNFLKGTISARKPQSLTTITLLEKPDALKVPCQLDYVGFKIPNEFVVGYGLDYQGYYRHLPYIARVNNLN